MHNFTYKDGILNSESVPLPEVASLYGTPTYVYSRATLERHIRTIDGAFNGIDHLTCYSVKANSNGAVLNLLAEQACLFPTIILFDLLLHLMHIQNF